MFGPTANHIKGAAPTSSSTGTEGNWGRSQAELVFLSAEIFAKAGLRFLRLPPPSIKELHPERMSQDRAGHWL